MRYPPDPASSPSTAALTDAVRTLVADFSVEVTPRQLPRCDLARLPVASRVFITHIATHAYQETVTAAAMVHAAGCRPVAHFSARTLQHAADLEARLEELRQAGVEEILLIAGDVATPEGPFASSLDVLASGLLERYGLQQIYLAGHPEGHPVVSNSDLDASLIAKNRWAAKHPLQLQLVTQFAFEAAAFTSWEERIRAAGNRLPVRVGLHGLASLSSMLRHGMSCGVGASLRALSRQSSALLRLASAQTPARIILDLARYRLIHPQSCINACHFFPFGNFDDTVAFACALQTGRFSISADQRDLLVE